MVGKFADVGFEGHEGLAHLLDLVIGERSTFHAANRLAVKQLSQGLNQAQDKLGKTLLNGLLITFDS